MRPQLRRDKDKVCHSEFEVVPLMLTIGQVVLWLRGMIQYGITRYKGAHEGSFVL
jgi:hypothetical protein